MHVFTYGTLMFPEVWRTVVGREFASVAATAQGYAVYRVQGAVFPGIVARDEERASGVLYLDVDDTSISRLDLFEDDFYVRQRVEVDCGDGVQRTGEAYVVPVESQGILTEERWDSAAFVASGGLDEFVRRFAGFVRVNGAER